MVRKNLNYTFGNDFNGTFDVKSHGLIEVDSSWKTAFLNCFQTCTKQIYPHILGYNQPNDRIPTFSFSLTY